MQWRSGRRPFARAIAGWAHPAVSAVGGSRGGGAGPLPLAGAQGMTQFPYVRGLTLLPLAGGVSFLLLGRAGPSDARRSAVASATVAVSDTAMPCSRFVTRLAA